MLRVCKVIPNIPVKIIESRTKLTKLHEQDNSNDLTERAGSSSILVLDNRLKLMTQ